MKAYRWKDRDKRTRRMPQARVMPGRKYLAPTIRQMIVEGGWKMTYEMKKTRAIND
jgi:hypothetical protein